MTRATTSVACVAFHGALDGKVRDYPGGEVTRIAFCAQCWIPPFRGDGLPSGVCCSSSRVTFRSGIRQAGTPFCLVVMRSLHGGIDERWIATNSDSITRSLILRKQKSRAAGRLLFMTQAASGASSAATATAPTSASATATPLPLRLNLNCAGASSALTNPFTSNKKSRMGVSLQLGAGD
jgi:hypothetical protein